MIIDAHTHIGDFVKISMPEDVFLASLDKYDIDFALCSCGSAVEVDHDQNPIPDEDQVTQHDNNERMLRLGFVNMQSELARLCGLSLVWKVVIKTLKI